MLSEKRKKVIQKVIKPVSLSINGIMKFKQKLRETLADTRISQFVKEGTQELTKAHNLTQQDIDFLFKTSDE